MCFLFSVMLRCDRSNLSVPCEPLIDSHWMSILGILCRSYGTALLQALPPQSLLLSQTDLNWNTVRYLQVRRVPPHQLLPDAHTHTHTHTHEQSARVESRVWMDHVCCLVTRVLCRPASTSDQMSSI